LFVFLRPSSGKTLADANVKALFVFRIAVLILVIDFSLSQTGRPTGGLPVVLLTSSVRPLERWEAASSSGANGLLCLVPDRSTLAIRIVEKLLNGLWRVRCSLAPPRPLEVGLEVTYRFAVFLET